MLIEAIYQQINNQLIQPQFKIIQKNGSIQKINKLQIQDILFKKKIKNRKNKNMKLIPIFTRH